MNTHVLLHIFFSEFRTKKNHMKSFFILFYGKNRETVNTDTRSRFSSENIRTMGNCVNEHILVLN